MKRLLVYSFIVLGLGLTFSVNAKANNVSSCSHINIDLSQQYLKCLQKETRIIERFVYTKKSISKKDLGSTAKLLLNIDKELNKFVKLKEFIIN